MLDLRKSINNIILSFPVSGGLPGGTVSNITVSGMVLQDCSHFPTIHQNPCLGVTIRTVVLSSVMCVSLAVFRKHSHGEKIR